MSDNQPLYAFYATLAAICYLATVAAVLAFFGRYAEALGFGGLTTGLIGVIRMPSRQSVTVENGPADPVPTAEAR